MTSVDNGDDKINYLRDLIENIRSEDVQDQIKTISQIPSLIIQSIEEKNEIINQLLLVIYNLNTDDDNFEIVNLGNRTIVFRNLLRLYTETIQEHGKEQIDALVKLTNHVYGSSELLIELTNALYHCHQSVSNRNSSKEDIRKTSDLKSKMSEALQAIKEKASENLYSDSLLMIHSIEALRHQQQQQQQQQQQNGH